MIGISTRNVVVSDLYRLPVFEISCLYLNGSNFDHLSVAILNICYPQTNFRLHRRGAHLPLWLPFSSCLWLCACRGCRDGGPAGRPVAVY